jgi:RNA-directed DNA polymerase
MSNSHLIAENLAAALLSGPWELEGLVARAAEACGRKARWLRPLVRRLLADVAEHPGERASPVLARWLVADRGFSAKAPRVFGRVFWTTPTMAPAAPAAASWNLPELATPAALADWLGLELTELAWFADRHGREAKTPAGPLRHYSYRWLPKAGGNWRLLEAPKPRLKDVQRQLLHEILERIPPHDAAHGFRRGRSILTFASPHCGRALVLRFDLQHFFASVPASRVHGLFASVGYPIKVARVLTGLCTNTVPANVWDEHPAGSSAIEDERRFRAPHLPQGAPTSPALANICAYRLDRRLSGLAKSVGATYTRYADDLAFSGDERLGSCIKRLRVGVCAIALEEGFELRLRKSRVMRRGVCQHLAGVVVNARPNVRRQDYELLKAILTNCVRRGPASQNRGNRVNFREHLLGRIAHVGMLNRARGARLRGLFDRICWEMEPLRRPE